MTKNHFISLLFFLGLGIVAPQFTHATTSCSQTNQVGKKDRHVKDIIIKESILNNADGTVTTIKTVIIYYDDGSCEATTYIHNPKPDTFGMTV